MAQLFINIIGFNAAGKTTLAKKLENELHFNRVSGDDFRDFAQTHIAYFDMVPRSHSTEKYKQLNPLVMSYRLDMTKTLLLAGQNVIYDGSGNTKAYRKIYLDLVAKTAPHVKVVLITVKADEQTIVERLHKRTDGKNWLEMYENRKKSFEPSTQEEADLLLEYDQNNYQDIKEAISKLLKS